MSYSSSLENISDLYSQAPIPQVDGPFSPCSSLFDTSQNRFRSTNPRDECASNKEILLTGKTNNHQPAFPSSYLNVPQTPAGSKVHQTQYKLNEHRQIDKLRNDSHFNDFSIVISPSQQNVNIQCNPGFYSVLLRPCLEIFYPGAEIIQADNSVVIQCRDTSKKTDKSGSVVNNVIFLRVYQADSSNNLGAITIHLHHTSRKVQLQGSAKMYNGTTIPVWFLENFLLNQLELLASSHSYDISELNSKIQELVDTNTFATKALYCSMCNVLIKGKVKETCISCSGVFHKKCISDHHCGVPDRILSQSLTNRAAVAEPSQELVGDITSTPRTGHPQPALQNLNHTITQTTGGDDQQTIHTDIRPQIPIRFAVPPPTSSASTLNPSASSFVPPIGTQNSTTKNKKKSSKQLPSASQLEFDLNFQTVQLNTAKATILELEAEKKKLQQSKTLLEERIKLFEADKQRASDHQMGQKHMSPCSQSNCFNHCYRPHPCDCRFDKQFQQPNELKDDLIHAILNMDTKMNTLSNDLTKYMNDNLRIINTLNSQITPKTSTKTNPGNSDTLECPNGNDSSETSFNTIDENISDSEFADPLNALVLTNQLRDHSLL